MNPEGEIPLDTALARKVATMTPDERWARIQEIAHAGPLTIDNALEFAKLIFGPDAELADD